MLERVPSTSLNPLRDSPGRVSSTTKAHGFTIVELLIVIVVIAILTVITVVAYNGITGKTQDAAVEATVNQIQTQALNNETTSGQIVVGDLRTELSSGSRTQFLQAQNLSALQDKTYVTGSYQTDDGEYSSYDFDKNDAGYVHQSTSGTVTTYSYDKARIYINVSQTLYTFYGNPPQLPWNGETERHTSIALSRWSNEENQWVTTIIVRREKTKDYPQVETYSSCSPNNTPCSHDSSQMAT